MSNPESTPTLITPTVTTGHTCIYKRLFEFLLQDARCTSCQSLPDIPHPQIFETGTEDIEPAAAKEYTFSIFVSFKASPYVMVLLSPRSDEYNGKNDYTSLKRFRGYSMNCKGMIRLSVAETKEGSNHRARIEIGRPVNRDGWNEVFWFYAYPHNQPGTCLEKIMILEGAGDSLFLRSGTEPYSSPWKEKFCFWVPKL